MDIYIYIYKRPSGFCNNPCNLYKAPQKSSSQAAMHPCTPSQTTMKPFKSLRNPVVAFRMPVHPKA